MVGWLCLLHIMYQYAGYKNRVSWAAAILITGVHDTLLPHRMRYKDPAATVIDICSVLYSAVTTSYYIRRLNSPCRAVDRGARLELHASLLLHIVHCNSWKFRRPCYSVEHCVLIYARHCCCHCRQHAGTGPAAQHKAGMSLAYTSSEAMQAIPSSAI